MARKVTPPQQAQGSGEGTGNQSLPSQGPTPTAGLPNPTPPGPSPKFCVSCGKPVLSIKEGKATYCQECRHVFDEHGQGRPADFLERLELLEADRKAGYRDARVDNLDAVVKKLTGQITGKPQGIDQLNPNDPVQMGKLAGAAAMVKASLGALFMPRPKPAAPPAAPAAPPAQGGAK